MRAAACVGSTTGTPPLVRTVVAFMDHGPATPGGGDEGHERLDTDKQSKTERWLGCCRRRAQRRSWWPRMLALERCTLEHWDESWRSKSELVALDIRPEHVLLGQGLHRARVSHVERLGELSPGYLDLIRDALLAKTTARRCRDRRPATVRPARRGNASVPGRWLGAGTHGEPAPVTLSRRRLNNSADAGRPDVTRSQSRSHASS